MKCPNCNKEIFVPGTPLFKIMIETDTGMIECIVYIAGSEAVAEGLKPTKEYLGHLLKGKEFISEEYFDSLKNTDTVD